MFKRKFYPLKTADSSSSKILQKIFILVTSTGVLLQNDHFQNMRHFIDINPQIFQIS